LQQVSLYFAEAKNTKTPRNLCLVALKAFRPIKSQCMFGVAQVYGFKFKGVIQIVKLGDFQPPVAQVIQSKLCRSEVVKAIH
jgi:hypothetical protein